MRSPAEIKNSGLIIRCSASKYAQSAGYFLQPEHGAKPNPQLIDCACRYLACSRSQLSYIQRWAAAANRCWMRKCWISCVVQEHFGEYCIEAAGN